ncbi:MAG: selenocysteine-specific translation elongation factor [Frankiales bacterium]|nr:selenocysteine-specific translation elongation factor [Frankiales bacterium]
MHVIATAGHVDHGKSALVRALTGMEPDRYAEERRRGMTIDLGFAWTSLPSGDDVAFVDVPGHERFVTTMLAGVGPVPCVLLVVAADEGWMAQTEEHVAALEAFDVSHGVVAVTKTDVADPSDVAVAVRGRLSTTPLRDAAIVGVSARTGDGLDDLRTALDGMLAKLPPAERNAPVRLWVDRAFTISGAGTVVTGTLAAGAIAVGDELLLSPSGRAVSVRGLQSLNQTMSQVQGPARVAVNLRGVDRGDVRRGMALVSPDAWREASSIDVLADGVDVATEVLVHLGSAAVPAPVRPLGARAVRLRLTSPLPMHVGDRLLLREPAGRRISAAVVADLDPPPLRRRGDAARIASALEVPATPDDEVRRRGVTTLATLRSAGLRGEPVEAVAVGEWRISHEQWAAWEEALADLVADGEDLPVAVVPQALGLPDLSIASALVAAMPGLETSAGSVVRAGRREPLPAEVEPILARLAGQPLAAPDADEVRTVGRSALGRAVRAGALLHLGGGIYVAPAAPAVATADLADVDQPFTVSAAARTLGVSRRVAVPLLEHLDAARLTRKLPDGTRLLIAREG